MNKLPTLEEAIAVRDEYIKQFPLLKEYLNNKEMRSMDKEQEKQVMVLTQAINFLRKERDTLEESDELTKLNCTLDELIDLRNYILKDER